MSQADSSIAYIAKLAKLSLEAEELQALEKDMADIIQLMDSLSEMNTDGIEITEHVLGLTNRLREDVPHAPSAKEAVLSNTSLQIENCFAIPKMIE